MIFRKLAFLAGMLLLAHSIKAETLPLAGEWRFALDREDVGVADRWFARELDGRIKMPASLPERGIGDPITINTPWTGGIVDRSFFDSPVYAKYREPGHIKIPFWLQPNTYYAGVAWYQRGIDVPAAWEGHRTVLFLERPHWETEVWLDERLVGTNDSLSTAHEYDFGVITPGKHTVTIRVDNRRVIDIGDNSHAISDHTQGNWNGIVGRMELRSTPPVWIDDLQVYPDVQAKSITVQGSVGNCSSGNGSRSLRLVVRHEGRKVTEKSIEVSTVAGSTFSAEIPLGENIETWDEFHPALYQLDASLGDAARKVTFGMREFATSGTQFAINGRKTFIRGTLECCIFPKTGHPPTGVEEWKRVLRVARSYGLNLLRFHSYCPPDAAFVAGDEMGFYFQVETCWANQSTELGAGKPVDAWVYRETERILGAYGNHPSFVFMPYGNEPGGKEASAYLKKYVDYFRKRDGRRLWTSGSGWPELTENQFHITPTPRIQQWGQGLKSRINSNPPETTTDYEDFISRRTVPVISHEIGQWCVYPDFDEIPKYTGYLKPKNFEIFRDTLDEHGMGDLARAFLLASGKLQTLCYKEDIESALRTPGMGGFELLDLHDFPGQGTALVGVLNPFWESKGYVTARAYSRFCNATVPLARLDKRVFTTDETLSAKLEIAHFGPEPLKQATPRWKLETQRGRRIAEGRLPAVDVPIGNGFALGEIAIPLEGVPAPAQCRLSVSVAGFENDWSVWVYPANPGRAPADDILVTPHFDAQARDRLKAGGKVLLTIPGGEVCNNNLTPVKLGFSSIFWNTAWTGRQAPTTLGILCDPKNPALAEFPTEFHSDWQWWYLIHRAGALRLDLLPSDVKPIVRVIDDWVTARPLGLIVEGNAGRGKIVICGFDLTKGADDPVSRQILRSLEDYMESDRFAPANELTCNEIQSLAAPPRSIGYAAFISATADSEQEGYEAFHVMDGDPNTFWHSSWDAEAGFPHFVTVALDTQVTFSGFTALPRQDGNNHGWIKGYELYVSDDGKQWGKPVAQGVFSNNARLKRVRFAKPVKGRFVKLVALSGYADGPWASLAEFNLLDPR